MSYVKCALGVVGALGLVAISQQAHATTLADLISAGTPVVRGNVVYSDFSAGDPTASLPANAISVNFADPAGVQFSGNWNTLTPGANTAVIGYTITVNNGTQLTGAGLSFGGQVVVNNGSAFVGETLTDASSSKPYSMQVFYDGPGGKADNLSDSIAIDPAATSLKVVKSIDVAAADANSFAALNFVENTFTTTPGGGGTQPAVPEPMTLALLPLALAGLFLRKKLAH